MYAGEQKLIGVVRLPGGERVTVRPAGACDAGRVQDYVRALSPSARYDRFLGPVNELSPAELDRATRGDNRHMTLIAETKIDGVRVAIGEARYAVAPDGSSFEIAVSVADGWHGRGLGTRLLHQLECRARSLGLRSLVGDVLHSNTAMKRLARKAGFAMTGVPADARLVRIVKDMADTPAVAPCAGSATARLPIAA